MKTNLFMLVIAGLQFLASWYYFIKQQWLLGLLIVLYGITNIIIYIPAFKHFLNRLSVCHRLGHNCFSVSYSFLTFLLLFQAADRRIRDPERSAQVFSLLFQKSDWP